MRSPFDYSPPGSLKNVCRLGGGGSQQSSNYSTQQSQTGPPAFLQPYLQSGVQDLWNYYTSNPTAPSYYTGETVAPLSTQSQGAVNMASSLAANDPLLSATTPSLTPFLNGSYVNPNSNPDFAAALAAGNQPYIDQFNDQILPGITSAFESSGRTGSGLESATANQAAKNLDTTIENANTQAGANYYTTALNQTLQANGLVPSINTANWQNVGGLGTAGTTVDTQRQAQDTSNQAAYNYNSSAQPNYISEIMSMLNGAYPGSSGTASGSSTSYQPYNGFSSIFGNALGLAGLGLQAYSAFSDERLKEDISEPIGKTFEGIPIRIWRYKGDAEPRVGFIAQEVAEHRPEAVDMHPSGFLTVDYRAATAPRGLF